MADIVMENLIAGSSLHQTFDLEDLAQQIPDCSFDQDEQLLLVFRFDQGKSAVLLSGEGQLVCTGTKTMMEAEEKIDTVVEQLQKIDNTIEIPDVTLKYTVATANLQNAISLKSVAETLPDEKISYNPQVHPWLQYQFDDQLSILIFSSGKLVFTGNKNMDQLSTIYETLKDTLSSAGVL